MYLNIDEKGRLLIPAKLRKKLGLKHRVEASEAGGKLVIEGAFRDDFFARYAGHWGKYLPEKERKISAEELDRAADEAMVGEAGQKLKRWSRGLH